MRLGAAFGVDACRQGATQHLLIGLPPVSQSVHCLTNPAVLCSFYAPQALLEALTCWSSRPLITPLTLPLLTVALMTACLSSRTMQLAAASPSACNSRAAAPAAAGRRALAASLPAAAARPSTSLQAIAGAREAAVEAPKEQRPRPQPAVEVFPATSTSRMLNDNRGFVESHRCAPCLCPGCHACVAALQQGCHAAALFKCSPQSGGAGSGAPARLPAARFESHPKNPKPFLPPSALLCRIRGDEVGPDQKTSIVSIAKLLQEAAGNHAVAMWGRSTEGFASDPSMRDLIFVMTRMQIQMEHYPRW